MLPSAHPVLPRLFAVRTTVTSEAVVRWFSVEKQDRELLYAFLL